MKKLLTKDILRLYWRSSLRYPKATFIVLGAIVASQVANLISPWYLKRMVDLLALGASASVVRALLIAVAIIIGLDLLQQLFWRCVGFGSSYLQSRVMADLSDEAFRKTLPQSHNFFGNTVAGALVRKINRLSNSYEEVADQVTFAIIPLVVTIIGALIGVS